MIKVPVTVPGVVHPVAGFPSRIKCAILPWRALVHALNGMEGVASTEDS